MGNKTDEEIQIKKNKTKAKLQKSEEKKTTEEARSKKLNKHKMFDEKTSFAKKKKYEIVHHEYQEENFTSIRKIHRKQANKAKSDTVVTKDLVSNLEIDEPFYTKKKKSKTRQHEHEEENSTSIRKLDQKQRKKAKVNTIANEELSNDNLETISEKPIVKKKKTKLQRLGGESDVNETKGFRNNIGKKTIFVEGEPLQVPITKESTNNSEKNKTKQFLNDDEAEVNDEDIDKFCDDLDEEDNKQYEEWVKLIEASMHSNKKSK